MTITLARYPKNPWCNNYHSSPKGHLSRCHRRARYQLTILNSGDIGVLLRCQTCRNELYAEIEGGATFAILDEMPARVSAVNELPEGAVILGEARQCATPGCWVVFVPTHPRQKYHSRGYAKMSRKARL